MEKNDFSSIKALNIFEENAKNLPLQFDTQQAKITAWRNDPKIRLFLFNAYLKNVQFFNILIKVHQIRIFPS